MNRPNHDPEQFARDSFSRRTMKQWQVATLSVVVVVLLIAAISAAIG
jgi:hypothetical protein